MEKTIEQFIVERASEYFRSLKVIDVKIHEMGSRMNSLRAEIQDKSSEDPMLTYTIVKDQLLEFYRLYYGQQILISDSNKIVVNFAEVHSIASLYKLDIPGIDNEEDLKKIQQISGTNRTRMYVIDGENLVPADKEIYDQTMQGIELDISQEANLEHLFKSLNATPRNQMN